MESSLNQDANFLGIMFAAAEMVSQVWVGLSSLPILIYIKMDSISNPIVVNCNINFPPLYLHLYYLSGCHHCYLYLFYI